MWLESLTNWVTTHQPQWSGGWSGLSPLMISPHRVMISPSEWDVMTQLAMVLDTVLPQHPPPTPWPAVSWPAVFTSYDFYLTDQGPQLIEINTNAAGLPLVSVLSAYYGMGNADAAIRAMFNSMGPAGYIAIVDDQPKEQKTYFEFEMIRDWLNVQGWEAGIHDVRDPALDDAAWVYNRYCDFEWRTEASARLRACDQRGMRVSPHPWHYVTLAHKSRLVGLREMVAPDWWPHIPETRWLSAHPKDEWWGMRRGLFFKPVSGFGSRGVYRGDGMSRKVMDKMPADTVVQPFLVPRTVDTPDGPFKTDVRVYVHQGVVVAVGARLFRGQVTNAQTMGGGFSVCIKGSVADGWSAG